MHNSTVIKRIRLAAMRTSKDKTKSGFIKKFAHSTDELHYYRFVLTELGRHINDLQQMINQHRFVFHIRC